MVYLFEPRHKGISFRAGSRPSRRTACGDTGRKAQSIEIGRDQNQTHWPKCACVIGSLDSTIYLPLIYYPQSLAANALTRQWIFWKIGSVLIIGNALGTESNVGYPISYSQANFLYLDPTNWAAREIRDFCQILLEYFIKLSRLTSLLSFPPICCINLLSGDYQGWQIANSYAYSDLVSDSRPNGLPSRLVLSQIQLVRSPPVIGLYDLCFIVIVFRIIATPCYIASILSQISNLWYSPGRRRPPLVWLTFVRPLIF